jgi:hypothetical protein
VACLAFEGQDRMAFDKPCESPPSGCWSSARLKGGAVVKGEFKYGIVDGIWSREEANGTKKEWQIKDGIPKEIDQYLKGI